MTVAELKTSVFELFPRRNPVIMSRFDADFKSWMDDLSVVIPWNCLRVSPLQLEEVSSTWPLNLAAPTLKSGRWIAPGIMVTQAGISRYEFETPHEYEEWEDSSWWHETQVSQCHFVALLDEEGRFVRELFSESQQTSIRRSSRKVTERGCPVEYFVTTNDVGRSFLNLRPVPDEPYLLAVGFQRIKPVSYIPPSESASLHPLLTNHRTVVQTTCLHKVSMFFDEPNMQQNYERELYGSPPKGLQLAIMEKTGLIGYAYHEQMKLQTQKNQTIQFYRSEAQAMGRERPSGQSRRRYPNRWGYR
jgi:hypothetical protein